MLLWLQTIFCSIGILDFDLFVDLENKSDYYTKELENKGLYVNEEIKQKNHELTKAEEEFFFENQSNSNILDDLTNFIDECFDNGYKNIDYYLSDKMLSTISDSNSTSKSSTSNQFITNKFNKQFYTINKSINDIINLEDDNYSQKAKAEHSNKNEFCKNNTNLLLHLTQNCLLQGQDINTKNNTFLQTNDNVIVLSDHQNYLEKTNCINKPDNAQIDTLSNVIYSSIKEPENSKSSISANKNNNNVKVKKKKSKTDNIKNEQKSDNKSKRRRAFFADIFVDNEITLYKNYKRSEKSSRNFYKIKFKNRMPQFIKKLEISNLSDSLKQKSISALRNLSSFLDTINAIRFDTRKKKNKEDFLNSLNLACYQFSKYTGVFQKLLVFKLICSNLHKVDDCVFCCMSCCDFYGVNRLLFCIDRRFNSFYSRLSKLRDDLKKND